MPRFPSAQGRLNHDPDSTLAVTKPVRRMGSTSLRLIYQGTSVTSPAPKFMLGGIDNAHLYHNSTLALDVDTGEIRWYYQHMNDHWDLDHPFERILVDTAVAPNPDAVSWINPRVQPGEVRKVITGIPGKTGVVYTLDRETGEFLWATPTVAQNVISDIDGATGAVTENAEAIFTAEGQQVLACPNMHGGKDWEAGAYSPLTNTMYFPLRNMCQRLLATTSPDASHQIYALAVRHELAPGTDQLGTVYAISAETGETTWLHEQRAATLSLLTTGGGLVFGGDANGRFRAFDQETGDVLWEVNLGSPVSGFPVSFAVDGRQYVAVSTGGAATTASFLQLTPELRPSTGTTSSSLPCRIGTDEAALYWAEPGARSTARAPRAHISDHPRSPESHLLERRVVARTHHEHVGPLDGHVVLREERGPFRIGEKRVPDLLSMGTVAVRQHPDQHVWLIEALPNSDDLSAVFSKISTSFSRKRWCISSIPPSKSPVPARSESTVYMRSSKQRESAATLFDSPAGNWPAGPQGAGASWACARPLKLRPITTARMTTLMFVPSRSLKRMRLKMKRGGKCLAATIRRSLRRRIPRGPATRKTPALR